MPRAGHAGVRQERKPLGENAGVVCGNVRVRSHDRLRPAVEMPRHGDLFGGRFRVEVEEHGVAKRRDFIVHARRRRKRAVRLYFHQSLPQQAEHAEFHSVFFDHDEVSPRVAVRHVRGAA